MTPAQASVFPYRLQKLQASLAPGHIMLLAQPSDITYFTGFPFLVPEEREAFLLISSQSAIIHHASFTAFSAPDGYTKVADSRIPQIAQSIVDLVKKGQITTLLRDIHTLTVAEDMHLTAELQKHDLVPRLHLGEIDRSMIWELRQIKDTHELDQLRKAGQIAAKVWPLIQQKLKPGITERSLTAYLETQLKKYGSQKPAFPTIVAFGPHAALPHHQPDDTQLQPETAVLVDFGATVNGYRSDMTRTVWFGPNPSPEFLQAQAAVIHAYQIGLDWVKSTREPDRNVGTLDRLVRAHLTSAGFGAAFIHTTGHGVGLEIHEPPSIYHRTNAPLKNGFIITIEPGVYFADQFGFRYENTIAVLDSGIEELTRTVIA